ncbi:hypothetical protein [Providencia rettgeri]|uniref:hypothetical protein n=1 Tax=Providencia rettgeri TaxID=587 RepID=UPI001182DEA7|nr:hypothetical protein [Providencia rettgeri]
MSQSLVAQRIHTQLPPSSVEGAIQALENTALQSGADVLTVTLMRNTIYAKLEEYSDVLSLSPERILQSLEGIRGHDAPAQFYSDQRLPEICDAYIWPTAEDFREALMEGGSTPVFLCPNCNQESGHESECTAMITNKRGVRVKCGWILNPTSDTLRNSIKILIQAEFLNNLQIHHTFRPKGVALPTRVCFDEFGEDVEDDVC